MAEKYEVVDSIESLQNTITRVRKAQEEWFKRVFLWIERMG